MSKKLHKILKECKSLCNQKYIKSNLKLELIYPEFRIFLINLSEIFGVKKFQNIKTNLFLARISGNT